jgi:hypothetical protein
MATIKPNGAGATPKDWRSVWDEFSRLKDVARKAGTSTVGWRIEVPSGLRGLFNPWQVHWIPPGSSVITVSALGTNGKEAIDTLRGLRELYATWLLRSSSNRQSKPVTNKPHHSAPQKIPDPKTHKEVLHNFDVDLQELTKPRKSGSVFDRPEVIDKYRVLLQKIGPWALRDQHPNLYNSVGRKKAGILSMDLHTYWSSTEMGKYYPIPPFTDKQATSRMRSLEDMHKQREAADQEVAEPIDYSKYGW